MNQKNCPCGSNKPIELCCLRYVEGKEKAPTAEALMRSRYTAFCLHRMDYVRDTTDPQAMHEFDIDSNSAWSKSVTFQKLEILNSREEGTKGFVEFKAYFTNNPAPDSAAPITASTQTEEKSDAVKIHHEQSKFRKQNGIWFFRDGKNIPTPEPSV